jgi:D-sedoheptulose 7-phosphate isomerase
MKKTIFFDKYFALLHAKTSSISGELLINVAEFIKLVSLSNRKVILIGNGGSAAIASHVTVDLTKAANIRAINFNEGSFLTCFSNDYGYEHWAEKAIEFYADKGDLVILISSSGQSENIINAAIKAKKMGLGLITFSGFQSSNPLRSLGDINLWVDSEHYNAVETAHQSWLLSVVDYIVEGSLDKGKI